MSRFGMYRALFAAQWKHQRNDVVFFLVVSAAICPLAMTRAMLTSNWSTIRFLGSLGLNADAGSLMLMIGAPLVALAAGIVLAVRPYALDARANHAYALALPIRRRDFTLLRAATGATLAVLPAIGFLIGALVASQNIPRDAVVQPYAVGLAARFALATVFAFSIGFGIQYGLGTRALRWFLLTVATIAACEVFGQFILRMSFVGPLVDLLASGWSPLRVFFARWVLFDV